jgi:hypothetical protein
MMPNSDRVNESQFALAPLVGLAARAVGGELSAPTAAIEAIARPTQATDRGELSRSRLPVKY